MDDFVFTNYAELAFEYMRREFEANLKADALERERDEARRWARKLYRENGELRKQLLMIGHLAQEKGELKRINEGLRRENQELKRRLIPYWPEIEYTENIWSMGEEGGESRQVDND